MPWTDPSAAIGIDKPIRASTHLAIFQNFLAMAAGEPGAPRVQVPEAIGTTETDTGKLLAPDGAGGVNWVDDPIAARFSHGITPHSSADMRIPVPAVGTFLVFGVTGEFFTTDGEMMLLIADGVVKLVWSQYGGGFDGTYLRRYVNRSSGTTEWWLIRIA